MSQREREGAQDADEDVVSLHAGAAGPLVVRLRRARAADLPEVWALRREVFREASPYLLEASGGRAAGEDAFDERAHHFCCRVDGRLVAACRFVPCPGGAWELCGTLPLPLELERDCAELLQISRVVVAPAERQRHHAEALIAFACRWLASHTSYRAYFALCTPVHARYYRHFGATTLAGAELHVPGRGDKRYRFIRGELEATARASERWLAACAPAVRPANPTTTPRTADLPAAAGSRTRPATHAPPMSDFLERCDRHLERAWQRLKGGPFWTGFSARGMDRELYVALMREIFHYTRHNAQNQALAAVRVDSTRLELLRFCLRHAFEEAGHDLMVLHDLEAVGVPRSEVLASRPLPETQGLIGYLYEISRNKDATARLGYSYWAESCYGEIRELIDAIRAGLGLSERELTFFIAHEGIDARHFEEVRTIAERFCASPAERQDFLEVMETTLALTGSMLDAVWRTTREPALVGNP